VAGDLTVNERLASEKCSAAFTENAYRMGGIAEVHPKPTNSVFQQPLTIRLPHGPRAKA
jgi:hypothetical protein